MAIKKEENTFKISQLCAIQNLDNEDLFLVTDYENNKCYTRKLTYGMLTEYLGKNPQLIQSILADQKLTDQIQEKVDTAVSAAIVINTIDGGNAKE